MPEQERVGSGLERRERPPVVAEQPPRARADEDVRLAVGEHDVDPLVGEGRAAGDEPERAGLHRQQPPLPLAHVEPVPDDEAEVEGVFGAPDVHPLAVPAEEAFGALEVDALTRRQRFPDVGEGAVLGGEAVEERDVAGGAGAVRREEADLALRPDVDPPVPA